LERMMEPLLPGAARWVCAVPGGLTARGAEVARAVARKSTRLCTSLASGARSGLPLCGGSEVGM